MDGEFSFRFLGLGQGRKYTRKQSHRTSPFLVTLGNTTLELAGSCDYLSAKIARSIDNENRPDHLQ